MKTGRLSQNAAVTRVVCRKAAYWIEENHSHISSVTALSPSSRRTCWFLAFKLPPLSTKQLALDRRGLGYLNTAAGHSSWYGDLMVC